MSLKAQIAISISIETYDGYKWRVVAAPRDNYNHNTMSMSNIRMKDVGLLCSERPEPI
jgi:hypothetical protein